MQVPERLKTLGWNERVLTRHDFYTICRDDGVLVRDASMRWSGLYMVCEEVPVIVLNDRLVGPDRIVVGWHELGHHLMHLPGMAFFCGDSTKRKVEFEAQRFAACALIPQPVLASMHVEEIEQDYGYSRELVQFRMRLFQRLRI
jgi:Zn-dependent peptidase ImmA (M78 family)